MTFGEGDWLAGAKQSRALFLRYVEAGGNFVDTAVNYAGGRSEELLGEIMAETKTRERLVVATKFTVATVPGDPNSGGNGRKNILSSLDLSLRRLRTDYIDLYWLHMWDAVTPVEEVMSTLDTLVRSGKVRAVGLSNVPAWYAAKAQMLARAHGWEPVAAMQLEYSLAERGIEREHVPAALDLDIGVVPWSPLASGLLTGKYAGRPTGLPASAGEARPARLEAMTADGTLDTLERMDNPSLSKLFTERASRIVAVLRECAAELGHSPAQVALNWVTRRPGVVSTLFGATNPRQVEDNLGALGFDLPDTLAARLEQASRPEAVYPYYFAGPATAPMVNGGTTVSSITPDNTAA